MIGKKIIKIIVIAILKFAYNIKNIAVIFQNDEDKNVFISNNIIGESHAYKIKGSGVDLNIFNYETEPEESIICVLFTGRMLRDKGVVELFEAVCILKQSYLGKIQFLLCGDIDNNPNSLTKEDVESFNDGEYIQYLGYRTDIHDLIKQSHIFAFPSYYSEGVPKSLIEACAVGRPIITTDSVGCKDCVINDYNGFCVPIKNSRILAEKLEILVNNKQMRVAMGLNSRKLAEQEFSVETVVKKHLEIYDALLEAN